jgi:hypothetical protein
VSDIKDVKLLQKNVGNAYGSFKTVFSSSIEILIFAFIGIFISGMFNVQNKVNGSRRKRSKMFFFLLCGPALFKYQSVISLS